MPQIAEFKSYDGNRRLSIEDDRGKVFVGIFPRVGYAQPTGFTAKDGDAPAIAAAVLEAAGEVPSDPKGFAVDAELENSHPLSVEVYIEHALYNLKRALAIREYHAKPRISNAQVQAVSDALSAGRKTWSGSPPSISEVLRAALDSGVLQVPADNKEGDR